MRPGWPARRSPRGRPPWPRPACAPAHPAMPPCLRPAHRPAGTACDPPSSPPSLQCTAGPMPALPISRAWAAVRRARPLHRARPAGRAPRRSEERGGGEGG
ncbi:hypothetical protein G6F52_014163 [Rhizopus delemar]|nr:hypothetical protein G6F52_014163 [Rhizopus delemar]